MGYHKTQQELDNIAWLEAQIQAQGSRFTHVQSRFLSALDTLDEVERTNAEELASLRQANKLLNHKLECCRGIATAAEADRDDLRDAVLKLVEKVEVTNDYSTWPHSRMHISHLADPITQNIQPPRTLPSDEQLLSYAATLIICLKRERDESRAAHRRTIKLAESRMISLEARLSRRDAELAAYASHIGRCRLSVVSSPVEPSASRLDGDGSFTNDEAVRILNLTAEKNRSLEIEIKDLFKKLEQVRKPNTVSLAAEQHEVETPFRGTEESNRNIPDIVSPNESLSSHEKGQPSNPAAQPQERDIRKPTPHLGEQIVALAAQVDAFEEEQRKLAYAISTGQLSVAPSSTRTYASRLSTVELDLERIKRSIQEIRIELDSVKAGVHPWGGYNSHEESGTFRGDPISAAPLTGAADLLDVDDGEVSMELATPILPTHLTLMESESPPQSPEQADVEGEPGRIPYSLHPDASSVDGECIEHRPLMTTAQADEFTSAEQRSINQTPSSVDVSLQKLEIELEAAQHRLEDGELALTELQMLLDDMRT